MSVFRRTPREVYRVYAEDDCLAEEAACNPEPPLAASEAAVPAGNRGLPLADPRAGRLIGLLVLIAVTLGVGALVALHALHATPATRHAVVVAEQDAATRVVRPALRHLPSTAPHGAHGTPFIRHARASTARVARPLGPRRGLAGRHAEPPQPFVVHQAAVAQPTPAVSAGGEFDFER